MGLTKKEVTRKILELLENEFNAFDFQLNLKEQGFKRQDGNKSYFFYFLIYNEFNLTTRQNGFQIEPYVYIDLQEIEYIYSKITDKDQIKNGWIHYTLGNGIANLIANPDGIYEKMNETMRFYVFEDEHIKLIANALLRLFKEFALPYFLENNSVKRVDELFNSRPRENTVHMPNNLFRFVKGVIAAKLNGNPQIDKLLNIYSSLIDERDMTDDCRIEMKRLAEILPEIKK